jgi:hypothetical protein
MYYLRQMARVDPINFSLDSISTSTQVLTSIPVSAAVDTKSAAESAPTISNAKPKIECTDDVCVMCQS